MSANFSIADLLAFEIMREHEENVPTKLDGIDDQIWENSSRQSNEANEHYFLRLAKKRCRLVTQEATGIRWQRFLIGASIAILILIAVVSLVLLYLAFNKGPLFKVNEDNEMSTTWFLWMVSIQSIFMTSAALTIVGYWCNEGIMFMRGKGDGQADFSNEGVILKILALPTRVIACVLLFFISAFVLIFNRGKTNESFVLTLMRMFKVTLWPTRKQTSNFYKLIALGICTLGCISWVIFSSTISVHARIAMEQMDVPQIKKSSSFLRPNEVNFSEQFYQQTIGRVFSLPSRKQAAAQAIEAGLATDEETEKQFSFLWRDFMRNTLWNTILVPRVILMLGGILTFGHALRRRGPFLKADYTINLRSVIAPQTLEPEIPDPKNDDSVGSLGPAPLPTKVAEQQENNLQSAAAVTSTTNSQTSIGSEQRPIGNVPVHLSEAESQKESAPTEPNPEPEPDPFPKKLWLCGYKSWPQDDNQLNIFGSQLPLVEKTEFGSTQDVDELIEEVTEFGKTQSAVLFVCSALRTPDRRLKGSCEKIISALGDPMNFRIVLSDAGKLQKNFQDNPKYIEQRIQSWHQTLLELGLKRICLHEADLQMMTPNSESALRGWLANWLDQGSDSDANAKFVFANKYTDVFKRIETAAKAVPEEDGNKLQSAWESLRIEIDDLYKKERQTLLQQIASSAESGKDIAGKLSEKAGDAAQLGMKATMNSVGYLKMLKGMPKEWMVGGAIVGGALGIGATILTAAVSPAIAAATGAYIAGGSLVGGGTAPLAVKYLKSKLGFKGKSRDESADGSNDSDNTDLEAGGFNVDDFYKSALFYVLLLELQGNNLDVINREINSKLVNLNAGHITSHAEGIQFMNRVKAELDRDWTKRSVKS